MAVVSITHAVAALILIVAFGWKVPLCFSSFIAFVRHNIGTLVVVLVHRSVSFGAAQAIYLLSLDRICLLLLSVWHVGIPFLVVSCYSSAKRRIVSPDLLLIGALLIAICVVEIHAFFTVISQHNLGWVNTQNMGRGLKWGNAATQAFMFLAIMAISNILEELFYRVTMFEVLQKLFGVKEAGTVVLTGILFGLVHSMPLLGSTTELQRVFVIYNVITTTLLGIALGLIYARRKDLLLISLLHWWVWVMNIGGRVMAGLFYYWFS